VAAKRPDERDAACQQPPCARDLEGHQLSERLGPPGSREIAFSDAEAGHVGLGKVDTSSAEVFSDILPVLGQLERGTDTVRKRDPVGGRSAEHAEDELSDRIGREPAVPDEVVERGVAVDTLVDPVRLDQAPERLGGDASLGEKGRQSLEQCLLGVAGVGPLQVGLDSVEERKPVAGRLVTDVVDEAGEPVDGAEPLPLALGEEAQRDREVLARRLREDVRSLRRGCAGWRSGGFCGHRFSVLSMSCLMRFVSGRYCIIAAPGGNPVISGRPRTRALPSPVPLELAVALRGDLARSIRAGPLPAEVILRSAPDSGGVVGCDGEGVGGVPGSKPMKILRRFEVKRILIAGVLLLVAAALAGVLRPDGADASATAAAEAQSTVSVTGNGTASGTPDTAGISAGVQSDALTAKAALAANATEMNKVIAAFRAAGAKNITTQYVSLSPRVDPQGKPNGFVAANSVSATTALDKAGALIDAAVDAGANTVSGPFLTNSGAKALYKQALKLAVADARDHAETLAAAAGRKVGRVISLSEGGSNVPVPMFANAKAAADSATPIVAGEQEVTASVSVTFELR
jgi:uncharacterized protein